MPSIPKADICPELPTWASKEIANLTVAIARTTRGLDPSAAAKALKDAVAEDLAKNGAAIAKAASEGIGSEYTQKLIKASVDTILEEISKTFPESKNVVQKIKNLSDFSFSLIQIVINMTDNSPLTIASKVKGFITDEINERRSLTNSAIDKVAELNSALRVIKSRGPIIEKLDEGMSDASSYLSAAEILLLSVRTKLKKKILDTPSLEGAKSNLKSALEALSPLDVDLEGLSVSTNEEVIELYNAGYPEIDIELRLLKSKYTNRFDYSDEAIEELQEYGMSDGVVKVFKTLEFRARVEEPEQILLGKVRRIVSELREILEDLSDKSIRIAQLLNNYLTIILYMDTPKNEETNSQDLYFRLIDNVRFRVSSVAQKIENARNFNTKKRSTGVEQDQITDIDEWIAEIVAIMSVLELVRLQVYEEKKLNSTPANTAFYEAYEDSVEAFNNDPNYSFEQEEIEEKLGFQDGLTIIEQSISNAQSMVTATKQEEIDYMYELQEANIESLRAIAESMTIYEDVILKHLAIYSPEPDVSSRIEQIIKLMQTLGFDRLKDKLLDGDLEELYNMATDEATYLGAASKCVKNLAEKAITEEEKRKFLNVALKLDRTNRTRFLGRVQVSLKSIQALKALKDRVLDIESTIRSLVQLVTEQAKRAIDDVASQGGI